MARWYRRHRWLVWAVGLALISYGVLLIPWGIAYAIHRAYQGETPALYRNGLAGARVFKDGTRIYLG